MESTEEAQAPKQWYDIVVSGESIYLRCPKSAEWSKFSARTKNIPGYKWHNECTCYSVPRTARNAHAILRYVAEQHCAPEVLALAEEHDRNANKAALAKTLDNLTEPPSRTASWLHQRQAFHFLKDLPAGGLFSDMGTGKGKVIVDIINYHRHRRVLIVCPKAVMDVWPSEFEKHSLGIYRVFKLEGTKRQKLETFDDAMTLSEMVPVAMVVNYESAWRDELGEAILRGPLDCVVLDESHYIKSASSKVSQYFAKLGRRVNHKLILTGTPLHNSPLDVYGQYRFLDPTIFGTNYGRFQREYARMGGYLNLQVLEWVNQEQLAERMYEIAFRVTDEVLDLPEATDVVRYTELGPEAKKVYKELKKEFTADFNGKTITTQLAITKVLRLAQLAGGMVTYDDTTGLGVKEVEVIDDAKARLFGDTLDELRRDEPIVSFARFSHDIEEIVRVAKSAGRSVGVLDGTRNDLAEWQAGKLDVLAVQIQSGGAGIDLTRARYVIYYSVGHSLGTYQQSRKRSHRPGQTRPVTYIHLLVRGTVDEDIHKAMKEKKDVVSYVADVLRQ